MLPVTFCIKTFERPHAALRCLQSIRRFYDDEPVLIADDSKDPNPDVYVPLEAVDYLALPYDTGLSEGRNRLCDRVETPFLVMLDDDIVFTENTRIERFIPWLHSNLFDLLGGALTSGGEVYHFEGYLKLEDGTLLCEALHTKGRKGATFPCDIVLNFFAARTETLQCVRWDSDLKMGEHHDFYLRMQEAGARVGYMPSVVADHRQIRDDKHYNDARQDKAWKCRALFQEKRGINTITGSLSQ